MTTSIFFFNNQHRLYNRKSPTLYFTIIFILMITYCILTGIIYGINYSLYKNEYNISNGCLKNISMLDDCVGTKLSCNNNDLIGCFFESFILVILTLLSILFIYMVTSIVIIPFYNGICKQYCCTFNLLKNNNDEEDHEINQDELMRELMNLDD